MINVIKKGEDKLNTALEKGKVVLLTRLNGDIVEMKTFKNTTSLLKFYVKTQIDNDYLIYKTAKEVYLEACNNKFFTYLENFTDNFWNDDDKINGFEKTRNKARTLLNYDKIIESINEKDFKDGFYDVFKGLLVPFIDGENLKYEYEALYRDGFDEYFGDFFVEGDFDDDNDDDNFEEKNGNFTFEILFKK
jgi:hypothetical protein